MGLSFKMVAVCDSCKLTVMAGFTILELMIVLIITAAVVISSYPCWQIWLSHHQARLATGRIQQIIEHARIYALSRVEEVQLTVVCDNLPSDDWNQAVILRTAGGQLIESFPRLVVGGRLKWRGSLDCQNIIFKTDGSCGCQGSFSYQEPKNIGSDKSPNRWRTTLLMSGQTYQTTSSVDQ